MKMRERMEANIFNGFKEPKIIKYLAGEINRLASNLPKIVNVMEVCGGHTHSIVKYGLHQILDKKINFIHGPGCPVCVMPKSRIDSAIAIAKEPDTILLTLADMLRVPGSKESLQNVRADGYDVRFLYSPVDIIKIAKENPNKKVVFFAIGFETTTPMSCSIIKEVINTNLQNVLFFINHITVPEVMEALAIDSKIDAFIAPSHVSVITGSKIYETFPTKYNKPTVVAGFEPVDILEGILMVINQILSNDIKLEIQYKRSVTFDGNLKAQELIERFFSKRSFNFRGVGEVQNSGYKLRDKFKSLDAEEFYRDILVINEPEESKGCICPSILRGDAKPVDCKLFKKICTPQNPIGSCMVSAEGSCSAYFKYMLD